MPGFKTSSQNREMINSILDTAWSPVAKFRLLSGGISPNNLLEGGANVVGHKECIACGNCVDTCPVVMREAGRLDLQTERTSLHLEHIVDDSCLRCYRCIQVCPQVDSKLKILAARHRMTEKVVHWWMAIGYLLLAATGIALNHFRDMWLEPFTTMVSISHKFGAVMWLASPFLFYFFDRYHFNRTIKAVFSFGLKDKAWWLQAFRSVFKGEQRPFQGEYNSGQKYWYLLIFVTMSVLGMTGILRWFWEDNITPEVMGTFILIHIIFAFIIDINFAYHFGRKFLSRLIQWFKVKSREAVADIEMSDEKAEVEDTKEIEVVGSPVQKISA
ncbi:MAG: cytochrome b/b6 domain-containing protein [Bacillota bacterium]